jgi:uncharacterized protein (DUF1330 family)
MPKGYIYAELEVTDAALFETYRPLAAASIAEFGGHYAVRGGVRRSWRAMVRRRALCCSNSTVRNGRWHGTTRRNIKPH